VVSVAGGEPRAVGELVGWLLEFPSRGAREAALWAAPFARGGRTERAGGAARALVERLLETPPDGAPLAETDGTGGVEDEALAGRLSRFAARFPVDEDDGDSDARLALLAHAAAAAHGDARAEDAMADLVRSGEVDGAFALRVAANLRAAKSVVAFRVHLELVLDEKYAYAAAQAFSSVDGFGRTIGWREVKDKRDGLHDELADWLRRNRARLRFDRGRFRLDRP
jgi:hypothetical protein